MKLQAAILPPSAINLQGPSRAKVSAQPRLLMSDYWFLAGLLLALFYVADPLNWNLDKITITKHLPLIISMGGILLTNIGNWLFRPRSSAPKHRWQVLSTGFPLILLGTWIIAGSYYARKVDGISSTFSNIGLYMLFAFLTARVVMLTPARATIVRVYLIIAAYFSVFMVLRMGAHINGGADQQGFSFHELEALIIPLAVYFALRPMSNRYWQAFLTLFFLMAGLVVQKNTGFIVIALTLIYLWIAEWRFRFRESGAFRFWTVLWLILIFIGGIATAGYLAHQRGEILPSGNPQYRLVTYEAAIHSFYESPIWGSGFTKAATTKFKGFEIKAAGGNLPTHSDVLDMAAQGGVIALTLWLWGYLRIMAVAMRSALRGRSRDDIHAAAHTLACMSLASIVVYAFNPLLLQPAKALLVWSQLGMLLGVALHLASNSAATKLLQKHDHE